MIDFKINDIGDISLEEQKENQPLKISFSTSKTQKNLRINLRTQTKKTHKEKRNALRLDFKTTDFISRNKNKVSTVSGDEEKSQSIAIRLKTELNELQDFFYDFGSELNKMRHKDLNRIENIDKVRDYVENAIRDIVKNTPVQIIVEKSDKKDGNFKLETLKITICETNGKVIYSCTI